MSPCESPVSVDTCVEPSASREALSSRPSRESVCHQYIDRETGGVVTEELFADRIVRFLYCTARERSPALFRVLTGGHASGLLALLNFDLPLASRLVGNRGFLRRCGVCLEETVHGPDHYRTPRRVFERQIRYWDCRPMPEDPGAVVSPADSRVLIGSLRETSGLFLKNKFFELDELLGGHASRWFGVFCGGDAAICRLTPDKYHYNHCPVSGVVRDVYAVDGRYNACNPTAVVSLVTPYSKNKRVVTVIDTDVPGGTGVGFVAVVEVVALMSGEIVQCYSDRGYEAPLSVHPGMFVRRGQPKSLYRPGSSTDVLLFEAGRVTFCEDLLRNCRNRAVESRFALGFEGPFVETEVSVRGPLAHVAVG